MRKLIRYLDNPFDDPNISLSELLAFTTDHLQRMIANNPDGALDGRIAPTRAALEALSDSASNDQTKLGVRRARKMVKTRFRTSLRAATQRIEGALVAAFGPGAPPVREAFPSGRSIFNRCTDDLLASHLRIMNSVIAARAATLSPEIVALSAGLLDSWAQIHDESESATASKAAAEKTRREARRALQRQLYLNLVKLMERFPSQAKKPPHYTQQYLLKDRRPRAATPK